MQALVLRDQVKAGPQGTDRQVAARLPSARVASVGPGHTRGLACDTQTTGQMPQSLAPNSSPRSRALRVREGHSPPVAGPTAVSRLPTVTAGGCRSAECSGRAERQLPSVHSEGERGDSAPCLLRGGVGMTPECVAVGLLSLPLVHS